jgi:hypothetical protein
MTSQSVLAASRKRSRAATRLLVAVRRAERLQADPKTFPPRALVAPYTSDVPTPEPFLNTKQG